MRRLRVLVVDDSSTFRSLVVEAVNATQFSRVVATAAHGAEALERYDEAHPDLITLDLAMPTLDGLGFLNALRQRGPLPMVIVVTGDTKTSSLQAVEALALGATGLVMKPVGSSPEANRVALFSRVRAELEVAAGWVRASSIPAASHRPAVAGVPKTIHPSMPTLVAPGVDETVRPPPNVVAIGASTGGPAALVLVVAALPKTLACPVVVVQHMPPVFTRSLAASLSRHASVPVVEAEADQRLEPGTVYVAPGGKHLRVARLDAGEAGLVAVLGDDAPVRFCRPSCDVLFRSVAENAGSRAIGVVLTGMGEDGADGLLEMRRAGAETFAQDEATCVVYGMPRAAAAKGAVGRVLPIEKIGPALSARVPRKLAADE